MAFVASCAGYVAVAGGQKMVLLDSDLNVLECHSAVVGSESAGQGSEPSEPQVLAVAMSSGLLCLANNRKQLLIWNLTDGKLSTLRHTGLRKQATKIVIAKSTPLDVLVADRAGNVTRVDEDRLTNGDNAEHEIDPCSILGHVSYLTDLAISSDRRFLITADRDEKIRISHYPNAFDIHDYCFGHLGYVKAITTMDNSIVSISGDRTIRRFSIDGCEQTGLISLDDVPMHITHSGDNVLVATETELFLIGKDFRINETIDVAAPLAIHALSDDRILVVNRIDPFTVFKIASGKRQKCGENVGANSAEMKSWISTCKSDGPPLEKGENFGNMEAYLKRKQERAEGTDAKKPCSS